jgi:hypothetical protein
VKPLPDDCPIYSYGTDMPPGICKKIYPDGRYEFVQFDLESNEELVVPLAEALDRFARLASVQTH